MAREIKREEGIAFSFRLGLVALVPLVNANGFHRNKDNERNSCKCKQDCDANDENRGHTRRLVFETRRWIWFHGLLRLSKTPQQDIH